MDKSIESAPRQLIFQLSSHSFMAWCDINRFRTCTSLLAMLDGSENCGADFTQQVSHKCECTVTSEMQNRL